MKISAFFLALAVALPLGASAQVPPSPASMGHHHSPMTAAQKQAFETAMKSFHDKSEALRNADRKSVLGALTPANRALLQQVAGQLAISVAPDRKAAAGQLDAKLSSGEKQAILAADASYHTQSKALFQEFRTQMQSLRPSPAPGSAPHAWPSHGPRTGDKHQHARSAGSILLMTALGGEHGGMHMMHGDSAMRGGMHGGPPDGAPGVGAPAGDPDGQP